MLITGAKKDTKKKTSRQTNFHRHFEVIIFSFSIILDEHQIAITARGWGTRLKPK